MEIIAIGNFHQLSDTTERFFNKLKHFRAIATRYAGYSTLI
jgi:transposase